MSKRIHLIDPAGNIVAQREEFDKIGRPRPLPAGWRKATEADLRRAAEAEKARAAAEAKAKAD
jgi:hypothetical protein